MPPTFFEAGTERSNGCRVRRSASTGVLTRKERSKKMYPLIRNAGKLVTIDKEKAEVLNNFFLTLPSMQPFLPHLLSTWTAGWGLGLQNASDCKYRPGS